MSEQKSAPLTAAKRLAAQNQRRNFDLYHRLLRAPWTFLGLMVLLCFVCVNLLFAALYYLPAKGSVHGVTTFADAFFFSVQTFSTIGYGTMSPVSLSANVLVSIEAAIGMMFSALMTGLVFAKFSRPTAKVTFSEKMVVMPYRTLPTLCFRIANGRNAEVVNAKLELSVLLFEDSPEGERMRRFNNLELIRSSSPVFIYTWTAMHPIDESSPLHHLLDQEKLENEKAVFFINLSGVDAVSGQSIHARYAYDADDIKFNHRFVDVVGRRQNGETLIDMKRFHDCEALEEHVS